MVSRQFGVMNELLIMPVGDIHFGADEEEIALGMLKRHIAWGVEHGAYFIGMGDYIDTFSPSNRERLGGARLYDTAVKALDKDARSRVERLYEIALQPSKGWWLGMLEGHHFHQFREGITSDQYLSSMLDTTFLGTAAYLKLTFLRHESSASRGSVWVWCHHGVGGGSTAGAGLNRLEKVTRGFDADIYLMGHQHTKDAKPVDYIRPAWRTDSTTPQLIHATKLLVVTGSFLKGYQLGRRDGLVPRGGYVEKAMLNPVALGGVLVKIRPRWLGNDHSYWNPDLHAEV